MPPSIEYRPGRRGLVALGDSITVAEGQTMLGLPCQSWCLWLARALELPYTNLAMNGALAADVSGEQLARLRGPYELCCLYAGINDARGLDFDYRVFERTLDDLTTRAVPSADHLLMVTLPHDLGRPRAGPSVLEANEVIRRVAAARQATVVSIEDLRGWRLVLPDAVHLTALGQVELAERAARALAADGLPVSAAPADLAGVHVDWRSSARYALGGHAMALARDLRRRAREGTQQGVRRLTARSR